MEKINPQKYTTKERKLDPREEKERNKDLADFFAKMNQDEEDMMRNRGKAAKKPTEEIWGQNESESKDKEKPEEKENYQKEWYDSSAGKKNHSKSEDMGMSNGKDKTQPENKQKSSETEKEKKLKQSET